MGRFGLGLFRRLVTPVASALTLSLSVACSRPQAAPSASNAARAHAAESRGDADGEAFEFAELTSSPRPLTTIPPELEPFLSRCAHGDAALSRVAERFARRQSQQSAELDVSELSFALRAEGSPYVWPRAWTLQGGALATPAAVERFGAWLQGFGDGGERRCGLALVDKGERSVLAAVATDALADLEPLPVRQRAGSWIDVEAHLLVEASEAKLIVLGPSGAPYAVPTSFDGRRARARFRADRPGAFLIQLLANVTGGPRPVLEAAIYADVSPPRSFFGETAPGEPGEPLAPGADPASALLEMLNGARRHERLPPLRRDAALDALAERHAQAMRRLRRIAHDAGEGDPRRRVEAARLDVLAAGENVAHASNVTLAHRALWASPSHRENLLESRFDKVGIGIALDDDGSVWVCELFADFNN